MAPRKRNPSSRDEPALGDHEENRRKRLTKSQRERNICENRLKTIEHKESFSTEDRFTQSEKSHLLEAYDRMGFQVFQDMQLLTQVLPGRTERDLIGLIDRLKLGLQQESSTNDEKSGNLDAWLRLCHDLMGNFARDKRVNLDGALADALLMVADEYELKSPQTIPPKDDSDEPNYAELLRSFAQLLMGKFPNNMTPANSRISCQLHDHISSLVDSMNLDQLTACVDSASWLHSSFEERRGRQEMALKGLKESEISIKKSLTVRDLQSKNVEALCLELPKIKRITELMNPLNINESLLKSLMDL